MLEGKVKCLKLHQIKMSSKFQVPLLSLVAILMIWSCGSKDKTENKLPDVTTSQTADKQAKEPKASLPIGGTYSFGDNVEKGPFGSIIVYPLTDNSALFFLDVCRGAPSYNLGQLFGQMTIQDSIGTYDSKLYDDYFNCIFKFEFTSDQINVTTVQGHDDCGFGHAVFADNTYKLIDKAIPEYFIDGEGDTILFKGLTVEKYEHRNDSGQ